MINIPIRCFYHASFDDLKLKKSILAEMPGLDKYLKDKIKIKKINLKNISSEMLPCYESPLLTKEQEQHLFRKMNFFKYKAKKLLNTFKFSERRQKLVDIYLNKAEEIRNFIAESNFRLSSQVLKERISFYKQRSLIDGLLSDAYLDVLKSIEYFNWTLGHKFSTYAIWVIKKNFYRDSKQKISRAEKTSYLDDGKAMNIVSRGTEFEIEQENEYQKTTIFNLIDSADDFDRKKQMYVIENYFGLKGKPKMTLEKISLEMKVTKERVRQLKDKGIRWLKVKAKNTNLQDF